MKKKKLIIILLVCLIVNITLIFTIIIPCYKNAKLAKIKAEELKQEQIIKEATIIVELKEDLTSPFLASKKVSDYINNINGTIVDDYEIDTSSLGEKEINFEYINDDEIKIPYSYKIDIKDVTPPSIWVNDNYYITTDYSGNLLEDIVCADDYDDNPNCEIVGKYNTKKAGTYKLQFTATDFSGNNTTKNFTLNVSAPSQGGTSNNNSNTIPFSEIISKHKNENTKIGIDVSSWQGDIDYEAVKNAGVEFVFIRVGSTKGINGEYFLDKKFTRNIEGFNNVGIPVGVYFYSYANSREAAIRDANFVLEQIKGYKIDLPVAYDWESWSFYNEFHQSFYSTTMNAKAYLDTISNAGYKGALYSSKNYLEKVWFNLEYETWLAHYTEQTSYKGPYTYWQLCSNGIVNGINGRVDVNIMYLN